MTGFQPGDVVTDVISCRNLKVDEHGDLSIVVSEGLPVVLYKACNLVGSSICGNGMRTNVHVALQNPPPGNSASGRLAGVERILGLALATLWIAVVVEWI